MPAARHEVYIGSVEEPIFYFTNAELVSVDGESAVDLIGDELSIDTLSPVARYTFQAQKALKPMDYSGLQTTDGYLLFGYWNENPADVPYATECWYMVNEELRGKFYVDYVERVAKDRWAIHAMSIIGLLDRQQHRGGVYTGESFAEVLTEFFGGTVGESSGGLTPISGGIADCYVEDAVAMTTVHGLLPNDTKRNNLHQLLFAYVVTLTRDVNGDLVFSYLGANDTAPVIPDDRIYIGGELAYEQPITDVELTEFTYVYDETAERENVYDNTSAPHIEGEALVIFDKPVNPETIQTSEPTMIVRDANAVSAYVTGNGVISAIPYQVQSRILTRSVENPSTQNMVRVSNVTLVNPLNSSNVLDRLFDFYTQRKLVRASLIEEGERAGGIYRFTNPYGEETVGYIHRMSYVTSSITKADCEIIINYTPAGISTNMQNVVLLTGSGVWTVPSAIRERDNPFIRAVIIQGGTGGHGGYPGKASAQRPDSPGAGGNGGEGGEGGKVLIVDFDVSNVEVINYYCGEGGEGGTSNKAGSDGGETTFGSYSSAEGAHVPGGIMNLIDGKFYARTGKAGISGANGGSGEDENVAAYGQNGKSLTVDGKKQAGGKGGRSTNAAAGGYTGWAYGGGGGGAANGANGGNGGDGYVAWGAVVGGAGGKGAAASVPGTDAQYIGCGGNGGHGGGGGGAPGSAGFSGGGAPNGAAGAGGAGSKGGKGAPGGILIYY